MTDGKDKQYVVAVVGAGPAGLYAAGELASKDVRVALINRDIKPGGLAEYGIYHAKHRMKEGLRKQFRSILDMPEISYFGNVTFGNYSGLCLGDLWKLGFQAIMVTVGAQDTKWLGLPGEDLVGVYHAKDVVYHYNKLPPFSTMDFSIGKRVAIIGVGNVMMDIAHWTIRDLKVDEVIAVARRGPAEVKFTKKEMEHVAKNLDLQAFEKEIERVSARMETVGQDPQAAKEFILSALPKADEPVSETRFRFDFLASPSQMLGDENGHVCGLEVENTELVPHNGDTKAKRLGTKRILDVDTVIFCIGDRVDENCGLMVKGNEFVKNPEPAFPVNCVSYEAYDPETESPFEGVFVAGWSREASSGLVGVARKDGEAGAQALYQYLETKAPVEDPESVIQRLEKHLDNNFTVVRKDELRKLEQVEKDEAEKLGVEEYKMDTNEAMLAAIFA